jgi:lipid-A-disaccharide synthase-like uncharacterized protein
MRRRLPTGVGRQFLVGSAGQGLLSAQSFVVTLAAAHSGSTAAFGAFGIAFTILNLTQGLSYAMAAQSHQLNVADGDAVGRASLPGMLWATACLGGLLSLTFIAIAAMAGGSLQGPLLALAVATTPWLMHSGVRWHLYAEGRATKVLAFDAAQVAAALTTLLLLSLAGWLNPSTALLSLAAGSTISLIWSIPRMGSPRSVLTTWIMLNHHRGRRFTVDFIATQAASQSVVLIASASLGLTAAAALRGATALTGPLTVVAPTVVAVITPEARSRRSDHQRLLRLVHRTQVAIVAFTVAVGVAITRIPDTLGFDLLGDSWPVTKPLLAPAVLLVGSTLVATVPLCALRATDRASRLIRYRVWLSLATLALGIGGILVGEAAGCLIGLTLAQSLGIVAWQRALHAELSDERDTGLRDSSAAPKGDWGERGSIGAADEEQ